MAKLTKKEIESQAITHILEHVTKYENCLFNVGGGTQIHFRNMFDAIKQNFYGLFNSKYDSFGQEKIFYPATEFMVFENIKGIDVDTKDINVKARHPKDIGKAEAKRYILKDWMYKNNFGDTINLWLLPFVLDGHLIVKKISAYDYKTKKKTIKPVIIDIRNTFFDPHGWGSVVHDTPFCERSVVDTTWFKRAYKDSYINLDKLNGRFDLPEIYNETQSNQSSSPETELFEFWSPLPEYLITGNTDDTDWVECHLVVSNLKDKPVVHKLERNTELRPYEDVRFEDAPGRRIGRGVGEKLLYLQIYLNMVFNTKRMNQLLAANQLFQYRRGSGIRPEHLRRLVTGGAIPVEQVGDIIRIDTRDFDYDKLVSEEQSILSIAQRQTQTQEPASGEQLPASMPATNAVIQNQAVRTSTAFRQEKFGLFLSRLFKNQLMPGIMTTYSNGDILRLTGDTENVKSLKSKASEYFTYKEIENMMMQGVYPSPEQIQMMIEQAMEKIENNNDLYLGIEKLDFVDCDVEFFVTGESIDKNALIQTLQQILFNYQNFAGNPDSQKIMRELFNILGLDSKELMPKGQVAPQKGQVVGGAQIPQAPNEGQLINNVEQNVAQGVA